MLSIQDKQQLCQTCPKRRNYYCTLHGDEVRRLVKSRSTCEGWGNVPPKTDKIRLGFCMPQFAMGGITRVILTMMTAPVDYGIEWAGFAFENPWAFDIETAKLIVKHCPIYSSKDNPAYQGLVTIVPSATQAVIDRSDVVNPCGYTGPSAEFDAANWESVPLLIVAHGQCEWTRKSLAVVLSKSSRHILASVSKKGVGCFPEAVQDQVSVIHNGVDFSRCAPARDREGVRKEWGIGADTKAVGYIGRFAYGKNPLATAKAVAELGDGYHAVYVGEGSQQGQVITDVKRICGDRVTMLPRTEDVGTALAAMDCIVSASPSEGGPLTVIEAWLAGCPVVSTQVGIIPELEAEHGPLTNEIPFDPSPQDLADAVREAIVSDARTQSAKEISWKLFSSTRMVLGYEALLREKHVSQS